MGKTLFILTDVPARDYSPCEMAARTQIITPRHMQAGWEDGRQSELEFEKRNGLINHDLEAVCRRTGAVLVPLHLAFKQSKYYIAFDGGHYFYKDSNHLSLDGSWRAARFVAPYLFPGRRASDGKQQNGT
jgi:hypothetical protein